MKRLLYVVMVLVIASACSTRHETPYTWTADYHQRLLTDFCLTESQVKDYIKKYIPDVTEAQMRQWEKRNALECMVIDGKKRYFKNAGPNLFRIDSTCANIKARADGTKGLVGEEIDDAVNLPAIMNAVKQTGNYLAAPQRVKVKYTLTVNPDAVPNGKLIRCWLPYPRTDILGRRMCRCFRQASRSSCSLLPTVSIRLCIWRSRR
jgi:hypothetical protein